MLLPRKWALSFGLLAMIPTVSVAGPFDALKTEAPAQAAAQAGDKSENQRVAEDIAKGLKRANLVHREVAIQFENGKATISGQIKDEAQLAQVTRIVGRVKGVQTVDNQLSIMSSQPTAQPASPSQPAAPAAGPAFGRQVQPVAFDQAKPRSNQEVAQNIANALSSVGMSGYDVEIRYKNGVASLLGNVDSPQQAMQAHQAAASVPGVKQVLNKLAVAGQPAQHQPAGQPPYQGPQGPQIQQVQGYAPAPQYAPQQAPPGYAPQHVQQMGHQIYNQPNMPTNAWPAYAQYDNYAAVTYPSQYDASAFPYIGPYYPYPQVPMGWRESTLSWEDGSWNLEFDSRTDRWWWFMNPKNW